MTKYKTVCNQCNKCAVENTAVLGCADTTCSCHTLKSPDEICIVTGYPCKENIGGECHHCERVITKEKLL